MVVDSFFPLIKFNIFLQEWCSEVDVVGDVEGLVGLQALESFVLAHLVQWSLLDGTPWHYLAVRVNLVNDVGESVQLSDAGAWDLNLGGEELIDVDVRRDAVALDDHFLEFSSEYSLDLVEKWSAGGAQWSWQLRELHGLSARAPEEALLSELLLTEVVDADGHVVVS